MGSAPLAIGPMFALALAPILAQEESAPGSGPASALSPQAQAVYLVLAITLLLFLLLFIVIGINVARRIARRRAAIERLHEPGRRSAGARSAWVEAGKRAQPLPDRRDPTDPTDPEQLPPRRMHGPDDGDDDIGWEDETDLDLGDDDPLPSA